MKIRKNDNVIVTTGKDKGKKGKVLKVTSDASRIVVEKVNLAKVHTKAKGKEPGGILEVEKSIDISNVMLVCTKCKKPTRVGFEIKDGRKSRICKKCNKVID